MNELASNLISFLVNKHDFADSKELANYFNVSTKTIYRTVKEINRNYTIITAQRGLGYRIDDLTTPNLDTKLSTDLSPSRSYAIASAILFRHPEVLMFRQIATKFYLSESAFSNELKIINQNLVEFDVSLIRNQGKIIVSGTEHHIRQALNYMLLSQSKSSDNFEHIENIFPEITEYDKDFLMAQITLIQQELGLTLVDPYTINIFSHLYILVRRLRGIGVQINQVIIPEEFEQYPGYYPIAREVIENIANYLGVTVPAIEIKNLLQYIVSLRYIDGKKQNIISRKESDVAKYPEETLLFVEYIVDNYEFKVAINNTKLKYDLCAHVQPMLNRVHANVKIVNPLAKEVKNNYADVFNKIQLITNEYQNITKQQLLSDDEISFLTLYFERSIEEKPKIKNILIMCSTGIGTAQLLRTKIKNLFGAINIVDVLSSFEYINHQSKYNHNIDLIVSTVAIPGEVSVPVVVTSPLPTENDIRRIEAYLHA